MKNVLLVNKQAYLAFYPYLVTLYIYIGQSLMKKAETFVCMRVMFDIKKKKTIIFRVVSINVRGLLDNVKRRAVFQKYRVNADFLIMQETHSQPEHEKLWISEWGGKAIFAHGTQSSRGIAIFTSDEMFSYVRNIYSSEDGRTIMIDIHEQDKESIITLVAIYAPNQDTPQYFQHIAQMLKLRSENKIIIGDFNCVLNVDLDRKNTYNNNNKSKDILDDIMDEFLLLDIWRIHNPEKREYSWFKSGYLQKASRIDFALVSAGLDQKIEHSTYLDGLKTDHRALYLVVKTCPAERGTGYWKFNTTLLQDIKFLDMMNKELDNTVELYKYLTPTLLWEKIKKRIKDRTVSYTRNKTSVETIVISQLSEKVNEYESRMPLLRDEEMLYTQSKQELEDKLFERARGAIFRSKVKWYEEGEKNTKYFFSLEKARYNSKTCYKLIKEDGQEVTNQSEILQEQFNFYQNLYSVDQEVQFNMQNQYGIYVPESIRSMQEEDITVQDLQEAIKRMNNNKTPGNDGIPIDFYKVFWSQLKDTFYNMMNEVYNTRLLHQSARKGILNLIPKPCKDARYIKNLRPITLLNTDYKIIEKAVADKMIPALEHIINKDQRGFMKNRRISVNIRKMLDIMHQARNDDLEAVVLSLDFVKCFDKCSFSILKGSLEFFKFGTTVRVWTYILYDSFTVQVQNNGNFSADIDIEKGVHQGGCCSSVYFLVIAEILAIALRSNEDIDGITIRDIKNLLNQFADDMDIFSMCNSKSLKTIFSELEAFRLQSGFMVSYDKTTLYRIGSLRHSNSQLYDISQVKWSNDDITVLGVTIAHEDIVQKNYKVLEEKVKKTLSSWYNRGLTLSGKIQVVNTLVASQFVYKMMVLPIIPDVTVKRIDNMIREFLWNGKKSKIAYANLQNPKDQGGQGLVNLKLKDMALKATWPQILFMDEDEYANMVYGTMRCTAMGCDIWRCSIKPEDVSSLGIQNQFWNDVLFSWSTYNSNCYTRIENQFIWYNSQIKIGKKIFFWKDVYEKGLKYVYQLFQDKQFKNFECMHQEYGITVMRYNSLKAAIPEYMRKFFME